MRIFARKHARDGEPLRQDRRHVLAAVDGEIDFVTQQRVLYFFHEQAVAADFGQGRLLQAVARRLDDDDAAGRSAAFGDACRDSVGLPERELAAARPESRLARQSQRRLWRSNGATVPGLLARPSPASFASFAGSPAASFSLRPNSLVSASVYALTASLSPTALSCSVGVSSSFSMMRWVISSTRVRASGGIEASLNSSRSSSARRMASNRCRSATTVGIAPRARNQAPNFSISSATIRSACVTSLSRRARFSRTVACRSSML